MGNLITWVIAILIIGYGAYALIKSIKKEVSGGGCSECSGCSEHSCTNRKK